jgi:DNA-binding beta-propeller fold protein YncE
VHPTKKQQSNNTMHCSALIRCLAVSLLIFSSCKKEEIKSIVVTTPDSGHTTLVINEGTFNWGNASLSAISTLNSSVENNIFEAKNGRPLGDVFQSIFPYKEELWLIVNNSQKIERINSKTFASLGAISNLQSPRYALQVSENKVYVSDLYANAVHIINPSTATKTGEISCPGWTEEMILHNGLAWVCNVRRNKLFAINVTTDQIVDSVEVGDSPTSIVKDKNGHIWALCEGNLPPGETAGSIWKINPETGTEIIHFTLPSPTNHPKRLRINKEGNNLFYLNGGVYSLIIADTALMTSPIIAENGRLFYGLGIHPNDNSIWVSDAKDFVQNGKVYQFAESGSELKNYSVGIIPSGFYFY